MIRGSCLSSRKTIALINCHVASDGSHYMYKQEVHVGERETGERRERGSEREWERGGKRGKDGGKRENIKYLNSEQINGSWQTSSRACALHQTHQGVDKLQLQLVVRENRTISIDVINGSKGSWDDGLRLIYSIFSWDKALLQLVGNERWKEYMYDCNLHHSLEKAHPPQFSSQFAFLIIEHHLHDS
jgi:hypothetical protein